MALQAILGIIVFCGIAWALSENRKNVPVRMIAVGLGLQIILALILLRWSDARHALLYLNHIVTAIDEATRAGTSFLFGYLGGGDLPFEEPYPGAGFILAFRALPIVLVMSALSALLFYWKILPAIVRGLSFVLQKLLGIGGALGVGTAANIFVGMVEAPLFIRPYLSKMTRSEIFAIMTVGMATIAGTMLVLYALTIQPIVGDGALGHLLVASIISAPAALVIAQIMVPQEAGTETGGEIAEAHPAQGAMDAITYGTLEGLKLWGSIVAMLIVLVALVNLVNQGLAGITHLFMGAEAEAVTLQMILGYIMAPFVWLMGVSWSEAPAAGQLMGVKIVLNEFLAYIQLAQTPAEAISENSRLILVYAICGFANLGSLGIMIGGLCTMAPERRSEIVSLGFKSIVSGNLATMMTGAIAGIIMSI
ncbi:MAG: nucleoside:proton symporter [bacterium]|nr:nucleoside:proton symporter [bacterium]